MKKYIVVLLLSLPVLALAACGATATPNNSPENGPAQVTVAPAKSETTPPPTYTPTTAPPTKQAAESSPTATTEAVQAVITSEIPQPTLFDISWDDRSVFAEGLIENEQTVLDQLKGASVYHLDATIAPDMTYITGQLEVRYTNQENDSLDEIFFRLYPNIMGGGSQVTNVRLNGLPVDPTFSLRDSAMAVPLSQPLEPGEQAVIAMDFSVEVPTSAEENYASFAYLEDVLAAAHFYPIVAVYDDEGWNVEIPQPYGDVIYADSSFYLARITAPGDQKVIASGIAYDASSDGDTQTITFAAGPMRDFYLVSSNNFAEISEVVGDTTIYSYTPPGVAGSAEMALGYAVDAMRIYNENYGNYPFTELDLVATPTLAGGIEYPGVIIVAQSLYEDPGPFFESATTHEVAHQWFYSAVGNDQIDEPWIDESLTQYATWVYYRNVYGSQGDNGFEQAMEDRWNQIGRADIPIGLPVSQYNQKEYGAIVYGRGPLFFDALAREMGQETFDTFLRNYYQTFKWGTAGGEDLQQLAEKHCNCDLSEIFIEWVVSSQ